MISYNITTGVSDVVDAAKFDVPLIIGGTVVVMELVWWDARSSHWIFLVRTRTARTFPPGSVEIALDDLFPQGT